MLSAAVVARDDPPDDAEYHSTLPAAPVVDRLATVGLAALQKVFCGVGTDGGPGFVVTVTATVVLVCDSQVPVL